MKPTISSFGIDRRALLSALAVLPFTPALYDEARKNSWTVISMKNDWKRIFSFD